MRERMNDKEEDVSEDVLFQESSFKEMFNEYT